MKLSHLAALSFSLATLNCMAQTEPQQLGIEEKAVLDMAALACKQDQQAAVGAIALRDKGKTKEELSKPLPPRGPDNNRLAKLMYEILDDIYGYPEIKEFPYYVFRSEMCFRSAQGLSNPSGFPVIARKALECQTTHGAAQSHELINCIRGVVIKGIGK
ncbi:MAG: hypothetical protein V4805_07000 [Pseudomonadota bacterium]